MSLAGLVACSLGGCGSADQTTAAGTGSGSEPEPGLEVQYSGCAAVLTGPVCVLGANRELRLWVRSAPSATIRFSPLSGQQPIAEPAAEGGYRYSLQLTPAARRLVLTAKAAGAGQRRWILRVRDDGLPDFWQASQAALRQGDCASILEPLAARANDERTQAAQGRPWALSLLARCAFRRGDLAAAERYLSQAAPAHARFGHQLQSIKDTTALVWAITRSEDRRDEARRWLQTLEVDRHGSAEGRYLVHYFRGTFALNAGDLRESITQLKLAADQAARLGDARQQLTADSMLAMQLRRAGRPQEARSLMDRWQALPPELPACERGDFLSNRAWLDLLAMEANETPSQDPTVRLEQARQAYLDGSCSRDQLINTFVNLALAHLHAGDHARADHALEQVRDHGRGDGQVRLRVSLWQQDVEARLAIAEGNAERALTLYEALARLAEQTSTPTARWRASVGRALALESLGRWDGALEAYADAERQAEADLLLVPVQSGRELFLAQRQGVTQRHLDLLLRMGRERQALALARRARARALRSLSFDVQLDSLSSPAREEMRDALAELATERAALLADLASDWNRSQQEIDQLAPQRAASRQRQQALLDRAMAVLDTDQLDLSELPPVGADEPMLVYHRLEQGWAAFGAVGDTLVVERLQCVDGALSELPGDRLGDCLLAPFRDLLLPARGMQVLATGALRGVDVHALSFDDQPIISRWSITYGLDLPIRVGDSSVESAKRALVIGDPHGNLPSARHEVKAVTEQLRALQGWSVRSLRGRDATLAQVLAQLPDAALFHYAGHARYSGVSGWRSGLLLADDAEMGLADILALPKTPAVVVLSGCETGRSAPGPLESLGIAQSFLLRGSRTVLAAMRPVDDELALAVVERFYSHWLQGMAPADALRRTLLTVREQQPQADWASFRLMER